MEKKRKVAVILVDRANYGRLKPVMAAIKKHPELEMQLICSGTMVLPRFNRAIDIVEADGFEVEDEVYMELEGSLPLTMSKSLGLGVIEFSSALNRLQPDLALVIGDRYEALAASLGAAYLNICLAHIQGGEVSGSIDESARHCITKLANFHFPSTDRAAEYIVRMGERPDTVFNVGCPSGDIALNLDLTLPADCFQNGLGANINNDEPYFLVVLHPVTTDFDAAEKNASILLGALHSIGMKTVWLWPNIDAGSDGVSRAIRRFREQKSPEWLLLMKNFSPDLYLKILANAKCCIGNSSSFIRDSSFFGTPVVMMGDRQAARERASNVIECDFSEPVIIAKVNEQMTSGRAKRSTLYGTGSSGERIADILANCSPYAQKTLGYATE
jgi:UDP-hydrolysing UDP-N-acetyl-D-glucosamine 2-epimerase